MKVKMEESVSTDRLLNCIGHRHVLLGQSPLR